MIKELIENTENIITIPPLPEEERNILIQQFEDQYGKKLPTAYKKFLSEYNGIIKGNLKLFGLTSFFNGEKRIAMPSLEEVNFDISNIITLGKDYNMMIHYHIKEKCFSEEEHFEMDTDYIDEDFNHLIEEALKRYDRY